MAAHMNNSQFLRFVTVTCTLFAAAFATAQTKTDADGLIHEALRPSPIELNLRHLTDEIGSRVPGTPAMDRAVAWAVAGFKAAGADRVQTEEFKLPHSWAEGATVVTISSTETSTDAKLATVPAVEFRLRAVSIALGPALAEKHVPVVDVGMGTAADLKKAGDISGKMILVHSNVLKKWEDLFNEYMDAPPIIAASVKGN